MKTTCPISFRSFLLFGLALLILLAGFGPVAAQNDPPPPPVAPAGAAFVPGQLIVRLVDGLSINAAGRLLATYGAQYQGQIYGRPDQIWQVPEGQELALSRQISADPEVLYAEPDYIYAAFDTVPNDPYYPNQWAHQKTRAYKAWDITTGSSEIVIAIIDTGIDAGHPDLAGKIVAGANFVAEESSTDLNGHGTHVAGIAAANTNNLTGVAGVAWGARIMPVKVLGADGQGTISNITAGISWAHQNQADIINLSLGGTTSSSAMQSAINAAHADGILVVAAMGNNRSLNPTMYPAALQNVFAVAATGPTDVYAPYSQYGAHCDIAAPGGAMAVLHDPNGIYSSMPTYAAYMHNVWSYSMNYDYVHGTSQASPYVAGLAALVWSVLPGLTPDQVQTVIEETAVDLGPAGWDANYGHGRVDAYAALAGLQLLPDPPTLFAINNGDGDGNYLVDWNDNSLADTYLLQEDDSPLFISPLEIPISPESQFSISGRGPGTWYYRVSALNLAGSSAWSSVRSTTVKPNAPTLNAIDNPTNLDAYSLSWSAATAADGYLLQEDNNSSFTSPVTRYMGKQLQYNLTGQLAGVWYYRVRAYNAGGDSAWSSTRSTTVGAHSLLPPLLQPITNPENSSTFTVTWTNPSEVLITYTLEQSRDLYFSQPQTIYTGPATSYAPTVPQAGTWYFRVRALAGPANSAWSLTQSTGVIGYTLLPVVIHNYNPAQAPDWQVLVYENFETSFPGSTWTLKDSNGITDGEYLWSQADCQVANGSASGWVVGAGAQGANLDCGDPYPPGAKSWMISGPFDLQDALSVELQYKRWIYLELGDTDTPTLEFDWLCYMFSNNGSSFSGYCYSGDSGGWKDTTVLIPPQYLGLDQVWFGFLFTSDGGTQYPEGAFIDDILLRKCRDNCPVAVQSLQPPDAVPFEVELIP